MFLWIVCLFSLFLFFFWGLLLLIIPPLRFQNRIRMLISSNPPKKKVSKKPTVVGPRMRVLEIELQMLKIPLSATKVVGLFISFHVLSILGGFLWGIMPSILIIISVDIILLSILQVIPARRRKKISEQLPEGLSMMSSALKSGYSILQTIDLMSKDNRLEPLSSEFALILRSLQLGDSLEMAFRQFEERIRIDEVRSMVDAILITREIGGNLTHVIDRLKEMIQEANQLQREVKSITSQGRMSAWIVGSLPFGLFCILYLISPEYIMVLFHAPIGIALVCIALLLQICGIIILIRMTKMKVR